MTKHPTPIEMPDPDEASRLLRAGEAHAAHMGGGISAWKAAGLTVIVWGPS